MRWAVLGVAVLGACSGAVDPVDAGGVDARAATGDGGGVDARVGIDAAAPADAGPAVDPLGGSVEVARVEGGYGFVEGPQWLPALGVLVFSDIPRDRIHRLTPPSTVDVYVDGSGSSNGLAVDAMGRVLRAEHAGRRVARERTDGSWETVAERWMGDRLNSPNDLVLAADGTIYFTDPPYGLSGPSEVGFMGVYRVDTSGALHAEWEGPSSARPNGIALSPDERVLYVADSEANLVRAFDVDTTDGSLSAPRVLSDATNGADGMAIDVAGNLYVATGSGIVVLRPDGSRWGTISIPERPANAAFGGADRRTLYVTAQTALYRVTGLAVDGIY